MSRQKPRAIADLIFDAALVMRGEPGDPSDPLSEEPLPLRAALFVAIFEGPPCRKFRGPLRPDPNWKPFPSGRVPPPPPAPVETPESECSPSEPCRECGWLLRLHGNPVFQKLRERS